MFDAVVRLPRRGAARQERRRGHRGPPARDAADGGAARTRSRCCDPCLADLRAAARAEGELLEARPGLEPRGLRGRRAGPGREAGPRRGLMDPGAALVEALASRGGPRLPSLRVARARSARRATGSRSWRARALPSGRPCWRSARRAGAAARGAPGSRRRAGSTSRCCCGRTPRRRSLLPLAAGVAVAEALAASVSRASSSGRTTCSRRAASSPGILAEASSGGAGVEWVVLGIGVNVALDAGEPAAGAARRRDARSARRAACVRAPEAVARGGPGASRRLVRCPA